MAKPFQFDRKLSSLQFRELKVKFFQELKGLDLELLNVPSSELNEDAVSVSINDIQIILLLSYEIDEKSHHGSARCRYGFRNGLIETV